jgi:hypothetical protein
MPPDVFPLPLDISSLQKLTKVFDYIQAQVERGYENDRGKDRESDRSSHMPPAGVAPAHCPTAGSSLANHCPGLPSGSEPMGKGGEE